MTERFTCDEVRDRAFEYRRGELEAASREAVEEHLEGCSACRDYVEKLFSMMSAPPEIELPTDGYADALFGEIEARIEQEQRAKSVSEERPEEEFAPAAPGVRWGTAAIGLAAGFLLAVGIGWFVIANDVFSGAETATEVAETTTSSESAEDTHDEAADQADQAATFAQLRPRPSRRAGVGILASQGAEWTLEGEQNLVLRLSRGTVLVEYLPRDGRQFRVEAPNMRLRVVGTIFYVSANGDSSAGVVTGEVEVESDSDETVTLKDGQRMTADGRVEPIPEQTSEVLRSQVDVRRHHAALRERMEAQQEQSSDTRPDDDRAEVAKRAQTTPKPREDSHLSDALARRRAMAERAIRDGRYQRAETIYRELLGELDPAHPAAPSIHLDLAGLYLEQMDRPKKALPYLREFLQKWPNDVAATAVQRRLCVVSDQLGVDEPKCDDTAQGR
jgi:anti-sigma factor RsiW